MPDIFQNDLTITIARPALNVYAFLATPDHHVGLHPSTAAISGEATNRACGVGEMWRETITRPDGLSFEADWVVQAADPGRRWVFRSIQFGGRPLQVTIAYTFDEQAGVTLVRRTMTTIAARYVQVSPAERETYASTRQHEVVMTNLKGRLESRGS